MKEIEKVIHQLRAKNVRLRYLISRRKWSKVFTHVEAEARFSEIYRRRLWRGSESRSGFGSGKKSTASICINLPRIVKEHQIAKVFDAGCGDFNWMKSLIPNLEVNYTGADIVYDLIEENNRLYKSQKISFVVFDVTRNPVPQSDLVICRDVLFHLSNAEVFSVLNNLAASNSDFMLITSHLADSSYVNVDIDTGDFRRLNLFADPFFLPAEPIDSFIDYIYPDPPRCMYLFSREQLSRWQGEFKK